MDNKGRFIKGFIPWNKGLKGWLVHNEESKRKISQTHKGRKFTEDHKNKLRIVNLGENNPFWKGGKPKCVICEKEISYGSVYCKNCRQKDERHHQWKGDDAGYQAKHFWVYKRLGSPNYCEICKTIDPNKTYHWSNRDHKYKRSLKDWQRVCAKCHKMYDKLKNYGQTGD